MQIQDKVTASTIAKAIGPKPTGTDRQKPRLFSLTFNTQKATGGRN